MFGIKIMDTGIKMVACFQKWDLFSCQLIGSNGKILQNTIYIKNRSKLKEILNNTTLFLIRCTKKNSCLQVLKGSHKMGRINHNLSGEQAGADLERLKLAKEKFQLVYVEMEPGDALFFHCNLLHSRYVWIIYFVFV